MTRKAMIPYVTWAEEVLGQGLPDREWGANRVTAAFGSAAAEDNFFVARFGERLRRLLKALPARREIIVGRVADIGSQPNWAGFYSELAAWDFFVETSLGLDIETEPKATQLGRARSPLDGSLTGLRGAPALHVKALADVTKRVLDGVRDQIRETHPEVDVRFNYSLAMGHRAVSDHRDDLLRAVRAAVAGGQRAFQYRPARLGVRIVRGGSTFTLHGYDPYIQAEELRFAPLADAHQFFRSKPNVLVYVVHPWFNDTNYKDFGGAQKDFFRALARRVACQLTGDRSDAARLCPKLRTRMTVAALARRLSGLIFLVDRTDQGRAGRNPTTMRGVIEAFMYGNPNANAECRPEMVLDQLHTAPALFSVYDTLRFDNY